MNQRLEKGQNTLPDQITSSPVSAPASSGNNQTNSGSQSQTSSKIVFDHEVGAGPNLLADNHAETSAPATERPVEQGSVNGAEPKTETKPAEVKPEADAVAGVLDYYTQLAGIKPEADAGTKQETETVQPTDAFKAIEANIEKVSSALKQAGFDDKAVEQIINANKLVGRQGTELGELRKRVTESMQVIDPVIERDAQGNATGFNGLRMLEMATKQFGPAEIQRQLATLDLKLVPLDYQAKPVDASSAREEIVRSIGKKYGIEGDDLSAKEIRELIEANPDAKDELTEELASAKIRASQQAQATAYQNEQQKMQERQLLQAKYDELKSKTPHLAELEPVMQDIYHKVFANGEPSKTDLMEVLHLAAEGKTVGMRINKIIESVKPQIEKALLKRLGIPESEVYVQPSKPVQQVVAPLTFTEDFKEVGPALV